jgi:DNA-directed RNA polymerase subunit RPC12/RpoP
MTIDLSCQQCDASFEIEVTDILEGEPLACPNCGQKAPRKTVEELGNAFDELLTRVADLRPRFLLSLSIESDDLPPPYDEEAGSEDEEEDEASLEDEDDEGEDEELDDEDEDDER